MLESVAISWAEEADFAAVPDTLLRWGWRCKASVLATSNGKLYDLTQLLNKRTALLWHCWMQRLTARSMHFLWHEVENLYPVTARATLARRA